MAQHGGRRELQLAALALAVMLPLCVILAEVFLRVAAPVPFASDVRIEMTQNLPGLASEFVYSENRWGYRSLSMQTLEKPAGVIRVLAIGGSTTKQETQSTEDTWTGLLDARLNAALAGEARVEVLALGGSGKTAAVRALQFASVLDEVDPDLILTLEGVNDLAWNGLPGYRYAGPGKFAVAPVPEPETVLSRCRARFQLCRRGKRLAQTLQLQWAKWRGLALEWHSEHLGEQRRNYVELPYVERPIRDPDPFDEFGDAIAAILDLAAARALPVIVFGQPVLWREEMNGSERSALWFWVGTPDGKVRPSTGWLEREMQRYNGAQFAAARSHGFTSVDLEGRIPKDLDHFFDDCHLTDAGSRLQADLVFPAVIEAVRAIAAGR